MVLNSVTSTGTASTADSSFEGFASASPQVLGRSELAVVAQTEGWFLVWSDKEQPTLTPESPPAGIEVVLVVHMRNHDAGTTRLVQSLHQTGGMGLPVFVLLFDACGAMPEDSGFAAAWQHEFMSQGAEDVLCNTRTVQEVRLAMTMAMYRRNMRLDEMSRMRACLRREGEQRLAEAVQMFEDAQATGLFWQSVDRFFKGFPALDLRLPKEPELTSEVGPCALDVDMGQGSSGRIFGAVNGQTGCREAVKVVAKASIKRTADMSSLYREVHLHSRLEHPHIVRMAGALHGPAHIFIRMEEASRATLFKVLRSGSLPLESARRFQGQLSDALAYCHAQGVAHRDLKPENIAFDASGTGIKVLDFGCCACADSSRSEVVGSFPFMAPEVLVASSRSPYKAARVDVWACAVILVEMVSGVHHFARALGWERGARVCPQRQAELVAYFGEAEPIQKLLSRRCEDEDTCDLEELMRGMFEVVPSRRWSARRVSESRWLGSS